MKTMKTMKVIKNILSEFSNNLKLITIGVCLNMVSIIILFYFGFKMNPDKNVYEVILIVYRKTPLLAVSVIVKTIMIIDLFQRWIEYQENKTKAEINSKLIDSDI